MTEVAEKEKANSNTYTCATGITCEIVPVSPFLVQRVIRAFAKPEPPCYTITTAAGTTEQYPYDEEALKDAPVEDKAKYRMYLSNLMKYSEDVNEAQVRLIISRGIRVPPEREGWDKEQQSLGLIVPQDPVDRYVHYVLTEVVGTASDLTELINRAQRASGVSAEAVEAARESFRHSILRQTA